MFTVKQTASNTRKLSTHNDLLAIACARILASTAILNRNKQDLLPPTKEEVNAIADVCLCLLARLLKNACIDLDEFLRVDRCRDIDELINF